MTYLPNDGWRDEGLMLAAQRDTEQQVCDALQSAYPASCTVEELATAVGDEYALWRVNKAIQNLVANGVVEITSDWKVRCVGKQKGEKTMAENNESKNTNCDEPSCGNYEAANPTTAGLVPTMWTACQPATVKCHKCAVSAYVLPLKMERRRPVAEGPLGPLVVKEFLMPEKWTRIEITTCVEGPIEVLQSLVYVCPNCIVNVG